MQVLTLAGYYLKRITRHRTLTAVALILPLMLGLLHKLPSASISCINWLGPVICAFYLFGIIYMQKAIDKSTGLMDGLRSSPVSYWGIVGAQTVAGVTFFAVQMGILSTVLALFRLK